MGKILSAEEWLAEVYPLQDIKYDEWTYIMEQYASYREQYLSIKFAEWIDGHTTDNKFMSFTQAGDKGWVDIWNTNKDDIKYYTTSELYSIFLTENNL